MPLTARSAEINIFVSTYDTDYDAVPSADAERAQAPDGERDLPLHRSATKAPNWAWN